MYECTGTMYHFTRPVTRAELFRVAEDAIAVRYAAGAAMTEAGAVGTFVQFKLAEAKAEAFLVLFLNSKHQLIACEQMFAGGLTGCEVHPRVIAQRALELNADAVIFAHNHPSGNSEPSAADRALTRRLRETLALIDVRVLDHFVVGSTVVSMAERGMH